MAVSEERKKAAKARTQGKTRKAKSAAAQRKDRVNEYAVTKGMASLFGGKKKEKKSKPASHRTVMTIRTDSKPSQRSGPYRKLDLPLNLSGRGNF